MKTKKILVIDDEPAIIAIVQVSLEILGNWEVLTASRGRDGLEKAKKQKPDVILLDVMMPDLNGLEVLQEIRSDPSTQNIAVILLTGKGDTWDKANYESFQIAGIISKPFNPLEISSKITKICES